MEVKNEDIRQFRIDKSPERGNNGYSGRNARERIKNVRKRTGGHTMKPKRRILSLLLTICLIVGLIPTVAFAADTGKAIQLGASNINCYDSTNGYDYIYYGEWNSSPIK